MMNVVLLTAVIFSVTFNHGAQGQQVSYEQTSSNNVYDTFVHRHILNDNNLDRNSKASWTDYLTRKKLCGRVPVQSFIDASEEEVKRICQGVGSHNGCNLFSSNSIMTVYNVRSKLVNQHCQVASLPEPRQQEVVVACSKFQNQCLPVNYEAYRNQQPANVHCS